MAFLNYARSYASAADYLYDGKIKGQKIDWDNPIYFLYFHAIESALKAHLRAQGVPTHELKKRDYGHQIEKLLNKCCELGLRLPYNQKLDFVNVARLLDSGNRQSGFRYYNMDSGNIPEISWLRQATAEFLNVAQSMVHAAEGDKPTGRAVKAVLRIGKPRPMN